MTSFDHAELRKIFEKTEAKSHAARVRVSAAAAGCSIGTMSRAILTRGHNSSTKGPTAPSGKGIFLGPDHPATIERRTLFPTTVIPVDEDVLKPGAMSGKLGPVISKGAWRGYTVYQLSLEERASCPSSCQHWGSCYGNAMPFAKRYRHGPELEARLPLEVGKLILKHPEGVAIRLHTLGDFYSWQYVYLWRNLIEEHQKLRVFGFTAHVDVENDNIARTIAYTVKAHWPRFAIRFSNGAAPRLTTLSIEHPISKPADAIICPAQWTASGKRAETCSTCALCWSTTKRIAFLRH